MNVSLVPRSTRGEVYQAINGERHYQDDCVILNSAHAGMDVDRSLGAYLLAINEHTIKANEAMAGPQPAGTVQALHELREVAALAVAAMEYHGAYSRDVFAERMNGRPLPGHGNGDPAQGPAA